MLILNWYRCDKRHDRTYFQGVNKFRNLSLANNTSVIYTHTHSHNCYLLVELHTEYVVSRTYCWHATLTSGIWFYMKYYVANICMYNVLCCIVFHVYIFFTKLNNVYILILIFIWKTHNYVERIVCYNRRMTCTINTEWDFTNSVCCANHFSSYIYW